MKVLIIKTSSMGDIIHTLPAITDAQRQIPGIQFDWVVEEAFQEIPGWHQSINRTIPVGIRRWRKNLLKTFRNNEWGQFKQLLQEEQYDYVIDAQGLLKSAFLTFFSLTKQHGKTYGLDKNSAREPLAAMFYRNKVFVPKVLHATQRVRLLFAQIFNYKIDNLSLNYGIRNHFKREADTSRHLLFFHSTTWPTKHWPESYWQQLITLANQAGFYIDLAWGNQEELQRALRLQETALNKEQVIVLEKFSLSAMAAKLRNTKAVVAVDTGLAHLAAAMDVPAITLFGPTNPELTGPRGKQQLHVEVNSECAPCFKKRCLKEPSAPIQPPCYFAITPELVWKKLQKLLSKEQ